MQQRTFYGKYRGVVTDIQDPLGMGRVRARVPDVTENDDTGWALPNVPFGGKGMGFVALPIIGSRVWIEFEQGDPDYPIWCGCWWASKEELPDEASDAPNGRVLLKTAGGQKIMLDDSGANTNTITLQTSDGQKIVMNGQGISITLTSGQKIELSAGKISLDDGGGATVELEGPQVSINDDALEVI